MCVCVRVWVGVCVCARVCVCVYVSVYVLTYRAAVCGQVLATQGETDVQHFSDLLTSWGVRVALGLGSRLG